MSIRTFFIASTLCVAFAGQTLAHAHLQKTSPAADAVIEAPQSIEITYSEPLVIKMSSAMIMTPDGAMIDTDAPQLAEDGKTMIVPLKTTLTPGKYDVTWQVLSTDGHKTNGEYTFTVK